MIQLDQFDNRAFDRGAPRWKEVGWWLLRALVFQSSLPWPSALKVAVLRAFGAEVGLGVVIRPRVTIAMPWRLRLGDHVWIGEEVWLLNLAPIEIGSHVCLSQRCFLCTGSHDFSAPGFDLQTAPIRVGDHCWVAAAAFVGPGVSIGRGAMVKACVRLTRDLPAGAVADLDGNRPAAEETPGEAAADEA